MLGACSIDKPIKHRPVTTQRLSCHVACLSAFVSEQFLLFPSSFREPSGAEGKAEQSESGDGGGGDLTLHVGEDGSLRLVDQVQLADWPELVLGSTLGTPDIDELN